MEVIPAIDIMDRTVVRLRQGKFGTEKVFSGNPILVAKRWKDEGARLLHIIDLDGARMGKPVNLGTVKEIVENVKIDVEVGGGLRNKEDVEKAFAAGVKYVIIGTRAVKDEEFASFLIKTYKEKVIFAVDVKDKKVAVQGWKESSELGVLEYAERLQHLGARRIIYTDISRDGMMNGPNLENLRSLLNDTWLEVIASGGISSIDDIMVLKMLEKEGVVGAVVGMALYEGKIDLRKALQDVG